MPDERFYAAVVMVTLRTLPRGFFDRVVELQLLVKLLVILNQASNELGVAIVLQEL